MELIAHYRVFGRLGAGGMGEVYEAEDLSLHRRVALKVLPARIAADPDAQQQLIAEAQQAALLNHPNIATIYELGQWNGSPFIAMEYVVGETLAQRLKQGALPICEALDISTQIADALHTAHERGCIHCDLKSVNLMLTPTGVVKVLDFGLARFAASPLPVAVTKIGQQTEPPSLVGSLAYLSPEQARSERLDARTDIFSLGVVLYEMLTAHRPFEAAGLSGLLHNILHNQPQPLSAYRDDVPLELEAIIRGALEKDRSQRYASAADLLAELRRLREQLDRLNRFTEHPFITLTGHRAGEASHRFEKEDSPSPPRQWSVRRHRPAVLVFGVLAALIGGGVGLSGWQNSRWFAIGFLFCAAVSFLALFLTRRSLPVAIQRLPQGAAFRGLLPFQEADRNRFYGREAETASLLAMLIQAEYRFGVLYGDSGSGKTSLVRAGLMPRLWEAGCFTICCRLYKDPLATLLDECHKHSRVEAGEGESVIEYLLRLTRELDTKLVIIFDQFEEFFVNFKTRNEREALIAFIAECHNDSRLPVTFLLSIRADFLYLISTEFAGRVSEPLMSARLFHLQNFDTKQAAGIIEKSVQHARLPLAADLSRRVAEDLAVADTVLPSELQIVGERLQSKRIFTVHDYHQAGGKEPLVYSYLEDVIFASGDQESAKLILRSLISDENTRLVLPLDEIARRTQRHPQEVKRILHLFAQARLVREVQDEEPWRYELMHEYLIDKINQITGRVLDATQSANRLFKQYLSNYLLDKRTRIPISKVWFIRRYGDVGSSDAAKELMWKSWRSGIVRSLVAALLVLIAATSVAAILSVSENWEGVRFNGGHSAAARKIAFSPDGRLLVSAGEDSQVIVWDFARRERLATFTDHTNWVISVAFSPDGNWFATGSDDHTVIVWDAVNLKKAVTLTEHQSLVRNVVFSPNGKYLASSSHQPDSRTIIWEVGKWTKFSEIARGTWWDNLSFSADSRTLIYSTGEIYRLTGEPQTAPLDPIIGLTHFTLTADGRHLFGLDSGGQVWFWDMPRRRLLRKVRAHQFHGRVTAISPDGKLAASGAEDIVLWDLQTQTKLARLASETEVWGMAFSRDRKWLVTSHEDGALMVWDVAEREAAANFNEHRQAVRAVAFSPEGRRLASASEDRSVIVWNAESGEKEATLIGHNTRVSALAFSPDGRQLVTADQDGALILWDIDRRQQLWVFEGSLYAKFLSAWYLYPAYCLAFSPNGRWIATNGGVFDSQTGRILIAKDEIAERLTTLGLDGTTSVYGVAFSKDSQRLTFAMSDARLLYTLDTNNWQLVDHLILPNALPGSLSLSPDGRYLAASDIGGRVLLLQANPLRELAVLGHHAARVKGVAFSPDGARVVSASDDQTIALWDVGSRRLITRIGTHNAPVVAVAYAPDGQRIASGGQDKSVRLYRLRRSLWGYPLDSAPRW